MTTISDQTKESIAKSEHTPTPWRAHGDSFIISVPGVNEYGCPITHVIADVCDHHRSQFSPHNPVEANRDFILRACNTFDTTLAAMKQGRSALAVLAQSDPTYEPAWRALTDAIKAAEGPMRPEEKVTGRFLILSLKWQNDQVLNWWRADAKGYTLRIEEAGRYSADQIAANLDYYNDGKNTLAIAEDIAMAESFKMVHNFSTLVVKMKEQTAARNPFVIRKPGTLSALPTAPEGMCEQPSDAEQTRFDAENVADPYDRGRL